MKTRGAGCAQLRSIESTARERGGGALAFPLDGIIHKPFPRL